MTRGNLRKDRIKNCQKGRDAFRTKNSPPGLSNPMLLQSRVIQSYHTLGYILQLFLSKRLQLRKKKSQEIPALSKCGSGSHPCGQENVAPTALPREEGQMVTSKKDLLGG